MNKYSNIYGKTIILTGASSGIGEMAAKALAEQGATLLLVARREDELNRVVDDISRVGGQARAYVADLSEQASVEQCCQRLLDDNEQIDVLINNAGRSIRRSVKDSFERPHDFQRTMQLNYFGALYMMLGILPHFVERDSGHVINVSSYSTLMPVPRYSAYIASKKALEGVTGSFAAELEPTGIDFSIINYPLVRTPMSTATGIYKNIKMMEAEDAAEWLLRAVEKRPGRIAPKVGEAWAVATAALPGPTTRMTGKFMNYMAKRLSNKASAKVESIRENNQ